MNNNLSITITTGTIVRILLILAGAVLLWQLRDLVLILLTAIVLASAAEPAIRAFMRMKVPRVFSVLAVYAVVIGLFAALIYAFVPTLLQETSGLLKDMPTLTEMLEKDANFGGLLPSGMGLNDAQASINELIAQYSSNAFAVVNAVFGGVFTSALILVFSFYFAVQERGIEDFIRVVTPKGNEAYILGLWKRSQKKIGLWMQGQLLLALIIGALTYLGLVILGVKYALVLAVLAGIFELIPVFGIVLATVAAVSVGYLTGGVALALFVLALYVILQQFENHLLYPLVVSKVVGVPPLVVIIALIIGAQVAGFLGILLSVPMAAVLQELVADLDKWKHEHA